MAKYLQVFITLATLSVSLEATPIPAPTPISKLEYVCKPDGSMTITVPTNYTLQNIGNPQCTGSQTTSNQFKLTNCKNKNQTIALKHNLVFGGKLPIFSLLCMDAKYTMQLNATANNIFTSVSPTLMPTQPISYNDKIKMMIKDKQGHQANSAVIGETLSLIISAPQYVKIDPLKCSAVSGNSSYPIWDASSSSKCNVEDSVIESNWKTNSNVSQTEYSIVMYAFRLVNSNSLTISCTVDVCPNGVGCSQKCVTGTISGGSNKRRRRNADIANSEKVNRHLETNLRVYDSVEDKIQASGASVLTTSYVAVFCALVSALYHRQL